MTMDTITITKDEYIQLLGAQHELNLLEAAGVDNWEWYGEALYGEDVEENPDEYMERRKKELID